MKMRRIEEEEWSAVESMGEVRSEWRWVPLCEREEWSGEYNNGARRLGVKYL